MYYIIVCSYTKMTKDIYKIVIFSSSSVTGKILLIRIMKILSVTCTVQKL